MWRDESLNLCLKTSFSSSCLCKFEHPPPISSTNCWRTQQMSHIVPRTTGLFYPAAHQENTEYIKRKWIHQDHIKQYAFTQAFICFTNHKCLYIAVKTAEILFSRTYVFWTVVKEGIFFKNNAGLQNNQVYMTTAVQALGRSLVFINYCFFHLCSD